MLNLFIIFIVINHYVSSKPFNDIQSLLEWTRRTEKERERDWYWLMLWATFGAYLNLFNQNLFVEAEEGEQENDKNWNNSTCLGS